MTSPWSRANCVPGLTRSRVPPNVKFEVDDVESEWSHDKPFDYIFCRYMAVCILDWPKLTRKIYEYVPLTTRRGAMRRLHCAIAET
jgi:hypothetical protein